MNTTEKWLVNLFRTFWEQEKVPKTWKQGLIVKIPKKGDLIECGNWRGITLTSVPSKVFGVLIDGIREGVERRTSRFQKLGRHSRKYIYFAKYYRTGSGMAGNYIHHVCGL